MPAEFPNPTPVETTDELVHADLVSALTKLTSILSSVDGLEGAIATLQGLVDGLEGNTDGLESAIATLATLATSLNGFVDGLEGGQTALQGYVDQLEALTTAVRDRLPSTGAASEATLAEVRDNTLPTFTPKGFFQGTISDTAVDLADIIGGPIPAGARFARVTVSAAVLMRDDGTAPTTVGERVTRGVWLDQDPLSAVQFIRESSDADVNVSFYG